MLLQFSVSNYRCFRERQTLNLAASGQDKTLLDNCITTDLPGLSGKRWLKGAALYGANASGKTTVLEALKKLKEMVRTSAGITDPKKPISQIESFALCPNQPESPTAFSVAFVAEGVRYEYRVAATRERIWHESLRAFPKRVEQLWFSRDWIAASGLYRWTPERPTGFQRDLQLEGYTLSNMLFLSKAVASNRPDLSPVFNWFTEQIHFLDLSVRGRLADGLTLNKLAEQGPFSDRIVDLLRHADLGVANARTVETRYPPEELQEMTRLAPNLQNILWNEKWSSPELAHRCADGMELPLPWESESAGTRRLFGLVGPWLDIMAKGYTVCVDELETSMHPLMTRELLRLFFSNQENPHGAQILFTTHNPILLDSTLLRRDQIWFTDKTDDGEAHLYPLTDYSPRKGESLVRGYLSGRYGAVPFVPAGLLGTFKARETVGKTESDAHE